MPTLWAAGASWAASTGAAEDYKYDVDKDKYRIHNNRFDSLEEIKLRAAIFSFRGYRFEVLF